VHKHKHLSIVIAIMSLIHMQQQRRQYLSLFSLGSSDQETYLFSGKK